MSTPSTPMAPDDDGESTNHKENSQHTMRAVAASAFGPPNQVLTVVNDMPRPELNDSKKILIQVHACSLSPGDYRGLLGDKKVIHNPKTWPYIPGGDVCGTVEYVPEGPLREEFHVGETVVATWDMFGQGGLAEYHLVDPKFTVPLPKGLTHVQGAALANSASHALDILKMAKVQPGERVLVLGGSGGIGTLLVQMIKKLSKNEEETDQQPTYVAATSTDEALMKRLGVDKTIDYTKQNVWEVKDWRDDENNKFDCIIDLAIGVEAWNQCQPILKGCRQGGRFIAVVQQQWYIHGDTMTEIIASTLLPPLKRQLFNLFRWTTPFYKMYLGGATQSSMTEMLQKVASGEIEVIVDAQSPHPFTTEGVRAAWNHHIAKKGHGKIVISLEEQDETNSGSHDKQQQ